MAGPSVSFDIDQDDSNASVAKNQEHVDKKLSEEIGGTLASLKPLPASSRRCCIYKVSDHIRKSNEEAYTPQVISIGPFHHDNPKLRQMESFKLSYLKSFTDRAKIKYIDLVSTIRGAEESVRECYSETITLGSDDFVKMILVDASFIIELFWKYKTNTWTADDRKILKPWFTKRMKMDLLLLENQLPFFIIEKILDTAFPSRSKGGHSFIEVILCHFEYISVQNSPYYELEHEILHFTDLLRHFCIPPLERRPNRSDVTINEMHSAAQLDEVGLKFKKRESRYINWSPLELKYADGVLEIPPFHLDSATEIYARNIVAFEEFHYREDPYMTDYYILLSMLIKTSKDLDVLVRKQIIVNWHDGILATSVLNRILETIDCSLMSVYYIDLAEKLNKFYEARVTYLQIMMAVLKREYFRNPWRGAATVGGILLLLVTIIQTVCALISVKNWK